MSKFNRKLALLLTGFITLGSLSNSIAMKNPFEISHTNELSLDGIPTPTRNFNLDHSIFGKVSDNRLLYMMNSAVESCHMFSSSNDFDILLKNKLGKGCKIYQTPSGMLVTSTLCPITWPGFKNSNYCYLKEKAASELIDRNLIPEHPVFKQEHEGEKIWVMSCYGNLSTGPCVVLKTWKDGTQSRIRFLQIFEDDQSETIQVNWLKQSEWEKLISVNEKENEKSRLLFQPRVFEDFSNVVVGEIGSANRAFIGMEEDEQLTNWRKSLDQVFINVFGNLFKVKMAKKIGDSKFGRISKESKPAEIAKCLGLERMSDLYSQFCYLFKDLNSPMNDVELSSLKPSKKTVTVIESKDNK